MRLGDLGERRAAQMLIVSSGRWLLVATALTGAGAGWRCNSPAGLQGATQHIHLLTCGPSNSFIVLFPKRCGTFSGLLQPEDGVLLPASCTVKLFYLISSDESFILQQPPLVSCPHVFCWHGRSGCCSTASSSLICHPSGSACPRARHADSDFPSDSCCTFVDAAALFYILALISISTIALTPRKLSTLLEDVHDTNVMLDHGGTLPYSERCTLGVLPAHFCERRLCSRRYKRILQHGRKTNRLMTFKKSRFVFGPRNEKRTPSF